MPFYGKAFYNLLFLNSKENPHSSAEDWQKIDYRVLSSKQLLDLLQDFGMSLDEEGFCYYAKMCETPEELLELFVSDNEEEVDPAPIYLIIFELWRRLVPEKRSISIFCDEFDHLIHAYDKEPGAYDEMIQEKLLALQDILDANVDSGEKEHKIFSAISSYLAHDLESFIYDYTYHQIEVDNDTLASETIDGFYPYIKEKLWFDYLKLQLFFKSPGEELNTFFSHFIERLVAKPDFDLFFEVLSFLTKKDCIPAFLSVYRYVLGKIKNNEQLGEMLVLASGYYHLMDDLEMKKRCLEGATEVNKRSKKGKIKDEDSWYQLLAAV